MSALLPPLDYPLSIFTPSTVQCTRFYSDASIHSLKKNNDSIFFSNIKRYQVDINNKKLESKRNLINHDNPKVKLKNRKQETFSCLDEHLAENIRKRLPPRIGVSSEWRLCYSLDQHGASFSTLYQTVNNQGPCLLVIQDTNDEVFGAYLSEGIQLQSSCYGTGECFLWKKDKNTSDITVYPWTSSNDYLIYSTSEFIAMGGGQGRFGLWLHSDLTHGYTEPCTTFNNPCLTSNPAFTCLGMEVWSFHI